MDKKEIPYSFGDVQKKESSEIFLLAFTRIQIVSIVRTCSTGSNILLPANLKSLTQKRRKRTVKKKKRETKKKLESNSTSTPESDAEVGRSRKFFLLQQSD